MTRLLAHVVGFARELRSAGVGVTPPQIERFVRALELVGLDRAQNVRDAARATLATSREEADTIDAVFDRVWMRRKPPDRSTPPAAAAAADGRDRAGAAHRPGARRRTSGRPGSDGHVERRRAPALETLRSTHT